MRCGPPPEHIRTLSTGDTVMDVTATRIGIKAHYPAGWPKRPGGTVLCSAIWRPASGLLVLFALLLHSGNAAAHSPGQCTTLSAAKSDTGLEQAQIAQGVQPGSTTTGFINELSEILAVDMRVPKRLSLAEEWALNAEDQFKECNICPEMIVVPSGEFIMGSPENEEGRSDDESPQHKVSFAMPFAVGRFAVTFDEWDACVTDHGCRNYHPGDRGWGRGRQPVINIWWEDAMAYVKWLSQKTKRNYRLLSEAEREYVTRAGTTTTFWWGSSISSKQANYDGSFRYPFDGGSKGEFRRRTLSVDSFEQNPWGIYQVHGNVSEWVEDCWHKNYQGAPSDGSAWVSADCSRRMLRGGDWNSAPWQMRSASRGALASGLVFLPAIGMRVARSLATR
jgi:formylglycine-generating enzyme required for sulfatase activity